MKIIGRTVLACGTIRYRLDNGWFADKANVRAHFCYGHRVGVWEPGASANGMAAFRGCGDSLRDVLAKLAAARGEG